MAVASRSSNSNAGTVAPTTPFNYPINQPAGLADGDVVLLTLVLNGSGGTITLPSGFVLTASSTAQNPRTYECIKVIVSAASEPATWNFVGTAGVTFSTTSEAFTGVDLATPQDVPSTVTVNAAATSTQINGLTTVTDGAFIRTLLAINSSAATITETSALVVQVVEVGGKVSEIDEGTQTLSGPTGPITYTISSSLASTGIITALRAAGAPLMIREKQPVPLLIRLLKWTGLGFGPFTTNQQPDVPVALSSDRDVIAAITGGGDILPASSGAHVAVAAVTGGGDILPVDSKAASGTAPVTGGGVITISGREGAQVTARLTGGGDILITTSIVHTVTPNVTGGGDILPASSGAHTATPAIKGGGVVTIITAQTATPPVPVVVPVDAGGAGPVGKRRAGRTEFDDWTLPMDDARVLELYVLRKTR